MKFIFAVALSCIVYTFSFSQLCTPGGNLVIRGTYGNSNFKSLSLDSRNPSQGDYSQLELPAAAWTCNAQGAPLCQDRSLIWYDVSSIPSNAVIVSAKLFLYAKANNINGQAGNPMFGTNNASLLQRVTGAWGLTTTGWSNQPAVTTSGQQVLPQSTSNVQNYTIDVMNFVQVWVNNPLTNYGMLLRLQTEQFYNSMVFQSGLAAEDLKPRLEITYSVGGTRSTSYRGSTDSPLFQQLLLDSKYPDHADSSQVEIAAASWTCNALGFPQCQARSLFRYDLKDIPSNALLIDASLYLYATPTNINGQPGNPMFGTANTTLLQKVTSPWNLATTGWANQPNATTLNQKILPQSTTNVQDYVIDVKDFVQSWLTNPAINYGMLLRLQTEAYYNSMIFASGQAYPLQQPKLVITYTLGACSNTIKGTLFTDNNNNGIKEVNEPYYSGAIVKTVKGSAIKSTIPQNGSFQFNVDTGTYLTSVLPDLPYHVVIPVTRTSVFSSYSNKDSISFAIQSVAGKKDLAINMVPLTAARPGFDVIYKIYYKNAGTVTAGSGEILFKRDSKLNFISSIPAMSSFNGDTIKWSYSNFNPQDSGSITIKLRTQVPPAVINGTILTSVAGINPVAGDETPYNNISYVKQTVTGSYDPNDKAENNGGKIQSNFVSDGNYLNYTIRFQNTGTDTAFNIEVRDTLDAKLDWNSLQMTGASHPYNLQISQDKYLAWKLDNVNLPDSNVNETRSHGFISYRVKAKNNINAGDIIHNTASIYFDFNLPVKTNDAFTAVDNNIIVLPLKLFDFSGNYFDQQAVLYWSTLDDNGIDKFEVQRSANGRDYIQLGYKTAKGNINRPGYEFRDPLASVQGDIFYYRLSIIQKDGSKTYSQVIVIRKETGANGVTIVPNPVTNGRANVFINSGVRADIVIKIIDMQGRVLLNQHMVVQPGSNKIALEERLHFAPGPYTLQAVTEEKIVSLKFIVIK